MLRRQGRLDQVYENGRYEDLDYAGDVDPPLDAAEAAWTEPRLNSHGRR